MKTNLLSLLILFLAFSYPVFSQYSKTANDYVPAHTGGFTFGTNPGWPNNAKWSPEQLADIYAGNEAKGIDGIGANSVRATLPDHFLEKWGYDIRLKAYAYYDSLGMHDLTCFIGFPSDEHTDTEYYGTKQSQMFKNMYEDIWDNGENGTPVNDSNYYALYVYKTALKYGDIIKYWEIWNEPDYTSSSAAFESAGSTDDWWHRAPQPDELDNLTAPFYHYIRLLRISYEVIKYVEEDDYVCLGGVGYQSFLDACLRYTDNPADGSVSADYPQMGGAYFDCVSYHSYPMYALRKWSNDIAGFEYSRHSDKAVETLLAKKTDFEQTLADHKYDGTLYPKKEFIITETNLPALEFDWYYGSDEMQYNFLMKSIISAQMVGIQSLHTYALYEGKDRAEASNSYHAMGMYRCLNTLEPYDQVANPSAAACRTTMAMLAGCTYDAAETADLELPSNIGGGAFRSANGEIVYALWAKTSEDKSEAASADYAFPSSFSVSQIESFTWNYTQTKQSLVISGNTVSLTGTPVFIHVGNGVISAPEVALTDGIVCAPNPATGILKVDTREYGIPEYAEIQSIGSAVLERIYPAAAQFSIDLSAYANGAYFLQLHYPSGTVIKQIVKE